VQPEVVLGPSQARPAKFAALRNPACRAYLGGGALAMMADNIEHVITYWVIWQRFRSPALTGFEVISHWLPFLLLSPYFARLPTVTTAASSSRARRRCSWWYR
jgi:hypothetical protein